MTEVDILNAFGVCRFEPIQETDTSIIYELTPVNDESYDVFQQICLSILRGQQNHINALQLKNMLFHMMNRAPHRVHQTVLEVISQSTTEFANWVTEQLNSSTLTPESFLERIRIYDQTTYALIHALSYYESKTVRIDAHGRKRSQIHLMRNVRFGSDVLGITYKYSGEELGIFQIMEKMLKESRDINMETILELFKRWRFFQRLSRVLNEKERKQIFKTGLDDQFLVTLGTNQKFVFNVVSYLNREIVNCYNVDDDNKQKNLSEFLNLATNFEERQMFNMYYTRFMADRLDKMVKSYYKNCGELTNTPESEKKLAKEKLTEEIKKYFAFERTLVDQFKSPNDNLYIYMMLKMIDDCTLDLEHNDMFQILDITTDSPKYKDMSVDEIYHGRAKWKFTVQTPNTWETAEATNLQKYAMPKECGVFLDTFSAYYSKRYEHRRLAYNFKTSESDVDIILGEKTYSFTVNVPQMLVLYNLGRSGSMSAKQIAEALEVELPTLNITLTGLLTVGLIVREACDQNNPEMKISIAENDMNLRKDVKNLIQWEKSVEKRMRERTQAPQKSVTTESKKDEVDIEHLTKTKSVLLSLLKESESFSRTDIVNHLKNRVDFEIKDQVMQIVLDKCESEKLITVDGDKIQLVKITSAHTYEDSEDSDEE